MSKLLLFELTNKNYMSSVGKNTHKLACIIAPTRLRVSTIYYGFLPLPT